VPSPAAHGPRVVIVDGTNTLYRAFFAIPALRAPDGTPTNAAYGFVNMLLKTLREERPDFLVVVFDARGRTFRHERYPDYKATRDAQPEDLSAQIPLVRELVDAYRFPVVEVPGYEADDVIATLIGRAPQDAHVTVVSTDRDLMQLVGDRVTLSDGIRERRYGPAEVEERFGVPPSRVIDVRALLGDTSDNIPGVAGIGEKSAAKLIREWGDLDNLLAHIDEVTPPRARAALAQGVEAARLSRELATLRVDAPVPDFGGLAVREPDVERLRALFQRLGFTRLLDGLAAGAASAAPADRAAAAAVAVEVEIEIVASRAALEALVPTLRAARPVPIVLIADGHGVVGCRPVGIALGLGAERAAFVPLLPPGPTVSECAAALRAVFADGDPASWLAADAKRVHGILADHGLELPPPCFDVEIAGALLDATGAHHVQALASRYLSRRVASFEDLTGRGARQLSAAELSQDTLSRFASETAAAVIALVDPLRKRLSEDELLPLFREVECPLSVVLSRMERAGVRIDQARLAELSVEYERELSRIEGEIYALAGERFLVSSPKQLQTILFEKLKLPVVRKTKTGFSTDESVLEQLAAHHELPARILAHRRLAKLKNTYGDALPPLVNPRTGRIHPTFHQLGAATGRLSAANPNVQNIPIRSEEGARIREAFVAEEGRVLLSADYSQVELRILAHFSRDESLISAFRQGDDIHRRTAADVWGVSPEAVSADQRARAKAVNFGIIYGLSAFGLANQLGIASAEAQQTIDTYFERYRGVRRFIDETIAGARRDGFVRTLLGRRRYLPDLRSKNRGLRQAAERMAVNTVIQGTQADLIKKAMIDVDAGLRSMWPEARMILQVHDELVFEVPGDEADAIARQLEVWMRDVLPLGVPLAVEVGRGRHWREAH
jgi:DNA polymerase-1